RNSAVLADPAIVTRYCSMRSQSGASTSSIHDQPSLLRRVQLTTISLVGCTAAASFTGRGGRNDSAEIVAGADELPGAAAVMAAPILHGGNGSACTELGSMTQKNSLIAWIEHAHSVPPRPRKTRLIRNRP